MWLVLISQAQRCVARLTLKQIIWSLDRVLAGTPCRHEDGECLARRPGKGGARGSEGDGWCSWPPHGRPDFWNRGPRHLHCSAPKPIRGNVDWTCSSDPGALLRSYDHEPLDPAKVRRDFTNELYPGRDPKILQKLDDREKRRYALFGERPESEVFERHPVRAPYDAFTDARQPSTPTR